MSGAGDEFGEAGAKPAELRRARVGQSWSEEEDRLLHDEFSELGQIGALAAKHERSPAGIRSRLERLGLVDVEGRVVAPKPEYAGLVRRSRGHVDAERSAWEVSGELPLTAREKVFVRMLRRIPERQRGVVFTVLQAFVVQARWADERPAGVEVHGQKAAGDA